jgi:hypothetical protein
MFLAYQQGGHIMPNVTILTAQRRGEIAQKLVRVFLREGDNFKITLKITDANTYRRKAGEFASKAGLELDEVLAYFDPEVRELFEEMLKPGLVLGPITQG